MTDDTPAAEECWRDACLATALAMVDPVGCGGLMVRARAGAVRDVFLDHTRALAGSGRTFVKLPPGVSDDRLIGGLDLAGTLSMGRPVLEPGVMARADGGFLLVPGAERLSLAAAARISASLDRRTVTVERDGLCASLPASFGLMLLDESATADEAVPGSLADRLAFWLDLDTVPRRSARPSEVTPVDVECARAALPAVTLDMAAADALCRAADALGIPSQRAPYFALKAARAAAALAGRTIVVDEDVALAARLVLAPRATRRPAPAEEPAPQEPPPEPPAPLDDDTQQSSPPGLDEIPLEVLLAAVASALPPGLLDGLALDRRLAASSAGKSGRAIKSAARGRRLASRPGTPGSGARLDIVATLRAAAPFQTLRRMQAREARPVHIARPDFRIARHEQRSETLTIFVVDASGSAALNRLAEAKGAVELLLAECYARRDWVALVAFRGTTSSLLLPPTRSLTRAKRCLDELPGGGGTPLAAGLKAALAIAGAASRQGRTPTTVLLTDGRANIALDGKPGRPAAEADSLSVARAFAASGERCLLIDTSPRQQPFAGKLAATLRARYLPLPYADATSVSAAVRAAVAAGRPA